MTDAPDELSWVGDGALRLAPAAGRAERGSAWAQDARRRLAAARLPGCIDLVATLASVLLTFDPRTLDPVQVERGVEAALAAFQGAGGTRHRERRRHDVRVCRCASCAPDLADVARAAGLTVAQVIERHAAPTYTVELLGFAPGFPYLAGLDPALHVARRPVPRTHVPAGSVAIAGTWSGIYPWATPGGWHLLGRTDARLFDLGRDPPTLLCPGDSVTFLPAEHAAIAAAADRSSELASEVASASPTALLVLDPGLATTVQDLGRPGHGSLGVATSGAADSISLRVANRLVGNPDGAAALEVTLRGGRYRCVTPSRIALVGAPFPLRVHATGGARTLEPGRAHDVPAGSEIAIEAAREGARAYLAVAGGIDTVPVLGSRATHLASGLGGLWGRALRAGDRLPVAPAPPHARPRALGAAASLELAAWRTSPQVRATDGSHSALFDPEARERFWAGEHMVSASSDRMGVRLAGPGGAPPAGGRLPSEGLPVGAVEVPSDGQSIVLLSDAPPTGGYPVVACLAAVDLARAGQWRPGERVRFERVTPAEARAAYRERMARLDALIPPAPLRST